MSPPRSCLGRVALLLAVLAGCGGDPAAQPAGTSAALPVPELRRLWREAPVAGTPSAEPARPAGTLAWSTDFDGRDERSWHALIEAPGGEGLVFRPVALTGGPVTLERAAGFAAVTALPARGGEALAVRVRARVPPGAQGGELPVAVVLEQRVPLDVGARLVAADVADLVDARRHACHVLAGRLGPESLELAAEFVTDRSTTDLALYLLAPLGDAPRRVLVESVELRRLPLAAHVAAGGDFPKLQRLAGPAPAAVRVALDRDEREGLLAVPGRRLSWSLPPCDRPQRLELSLGLAPRDARLTGAVRLVAELVDGGVARTLVERRRGAPAGPAEAAWEDVAVELPPSATPRELALACTAEGEDPPLAVFGHPTLWRTPAARRPHVVLISLDTLRPDRLGCYGGAGGLSPRLDALAAQGLRFANAYSTSSYTLPSHASLLTGQWPAVHGAEDVTDRLDPGHSPFLARLLAEAGWLTAAFTGGGYVSPEYGFAEGFDRYAINDPVWALDTERGRRLLTTMSWERAPMLPELLARYAAPAVEQWIAARAGGPPCFLFLHTYVVHNYAPDAARLAAHGLLGPGGAQQPFNHQDRTAFNEGRATAPADRARVVEQYLPYYDATVAMADEFVGRVLDALERAGLLQDTLVLVTSDHGEEFGEHGFFGHGETLHEPAVRVPLLVRLPAGAAGPAPGTVVDLPVSLADVAPWILHHCGLPADPRMLAAPPLGPEVADPPGRNRVFIELDTHRAHLSVLREGDLKLHRLRSGRSYGLQPGESRLYDLGSDAAEARDLSGSRPDDIERLAQRLEQFAEFTDALQPRGADQPLDLDSLSPEMVRMLQALGYAEMLER